ncbi:MAG: formylglycine-generating enzyme family protein, partial [Candidatus Brocadiia bacterium]
EWPFGAVEAARRQRETAKKCGLPVETAIDVGGGVKLELVLIPPGDFVMGASESPEEVSRKRRDASDDTNEFIRGWCKNEHPQHNVRITKAFYMGKFEVTQKQWERVMGNNPSDFRGDQNPVECVSWKDCQQFLRKLNEIVRGQGTFELPTEAQWEYACRAGTATPFYTGETISSDQANYRGDLVYGNGAKGQFRQKTMAVGSFKPNAFGLYDMHGNVWELCQDRYGEDYYEQSPKDNPTGPSTGESRVVRGGGWDCAPSAVRSVHRNYTAPDGPERNDCGFRIILVPPDKSIRR